MQETVNKDREKYIGGSDIPVIMNISPFKSRFDLLLEKAGYKENDFTGNVFTEYGNTLEPKIREYINENITEYIKDPLCDNIDQYKFTEGKHVREAAEDEIIGVRIHTDGENPQAILEIKTTSQIFENVNDYKLYLVQLLYYMILADRKLGVLAVYERPEDLNEELDPDRLHTYIIDADDYKDLIKEIGEAIESFIEDLKKVKDNPFITEEDLLPAEIPEITKRILAFEYQLKLMKETEEKIKADKARLKAAMQAASVKSWTTPSGYKITLVEDGEDKIVKKFNEKKFEEAAPETYKEFLEDKVQKGRAGYVKITPPADKEG